MGRQVVLDIAVYDDVEHFWCPLLGQTIKFGYCRRYQSGLPCSRVLTCYASHFDVEAFVIEHFSQEEQGRFLGEAKGRMEVVAEALSGARDEDGQA
jgi:hypothetical protein